MIKAWLTEVEKAATIKPIPTTATDVIAPINKAANIDPWFSNPKPIATNKVNKKPIRL